MRWSYPFIGSIWGIRPIPAGHVAVYGQGPTVWTCLFLMTLAPMWIGHQSLPMTNSDILDPAALLSLLPTLLPPSRKHLTSPQDAVATILHTIFSSLAFRLIGVNDISVATTTSTNILPEEWNKDGPGHYTFRYRHDQSSLEFVLKVSKLGRRTLINAIADEVCVHVRTCQIAYYEHRATRSNP